MKSEASRAGCGIDLLSFGKTSRVRPQSWHVTVTEERSDTGLHSWTAIAELAPRSHFVLIQRERIERVESSNRQLWKTGKGEAIEV